jgi:hypothetical protein
MRTSNETRLNLTGGAAAGLAAVRTLPVSDRVKQAAACAYEFDPLHDPAGRHWSRAILGLRSSIAQSG